MRKQSERTNMQIMKGKGYGDMKMQTKEKHGEISKNKD
jgi:hypothetical protein